MKFIATLLLLVMIVLPLASSAQSTTTASSTASRIEDLIAQVKHLLELVAKLRQAIEQARGTQGSYGSFSGGSFSGAGGTGSGLGGSALGGMMGGDNGFANFLNTSQIFKNLLSSLGMPTSGGGYDSALSQLGGLLGGQMGLSPQSFASNPSALSSLLSQTANEEDVAAPWTTIPQDVGYGQAPTVTGGTTTGGLTSGTGSTGFTGSTSTLPPATGGVIKMPWSDAQGLFTKGTTAKVTDICTGKTFNATRGGGTRHADSEPATPEDTKIWRSVCGSRNWGRRPIIVEIGGKRVAASMNCMPHAGNDNFGHNETATSAKPAKYDCLGGSCARSGPSPFNGVGTNYDYVNSVNRKTNQLDGHFCIHFLHSQTHVAKKEDIQHQRAVAMAASNMCGNQPGKAGGDSTQNTSTPPAASAKPTIKVYGDPSYCVPCKQTETYLSSAGIPFSALPPDGGAIPHVVITSSSGQVLDDFRGYNGQRISSIWNQY
jgi:hypothetical protein